MYIHKYRYSDTVRLFYADYTRLRFSKNRVKTLGLELWLVRTNSRQKHLYAISCIIIQDIVVPFSTISIAIGFYSVLPLWLAYLCYSISNDFTLTIVQGGITDTCYIFYTPRQSYNLNAVELPLFRWVVFNGKIINNPRRTGFFVLIVRLWRADKSIGWAIAIRTRLAFERVNESISFQSTTAFAVMVSGFGTLSRSTTPNAGRCCFVRRCSTTPNAGCCSVVAERCQPRF